MPGTTHKLKDWEFFYLTVTRRGGPSASNRARGRG